MDILSAPLDSPDWKLVELGASLSLGALVLTPTVSGDKVLYQLKVGDQYFLIPDLHMAVGITEHLMEKNYGA